uniref:Uncharacterized protein n=1 Tax=Picea glauca TaxID=3330 RepID=A0A101M5H4_PICGL|nr:hypothetical protein ABT39_MTgene1190 [Picea glauca]
MNECARHLQPISFVPWSRAFTFLAFIHFFSFHSRVMLGSYTDLNLVGGPHGVRFHG